MLRRNLLKASPIALAAPVALGGCAWINGGPNPLQTVVKVTLSNAQSQAKAIYQALTIIASSASSALSTTANATASKYLKDVKTAVDAFAALPSGSSSAATFAGNVITAISQVVAVLPLPTATSIAISSGVALLQALISGLSTITVTNPAALSPKVGVSNRVIAAPIPIPVS